jgi:hypothetical protein
LIGGAITRLRIRPGFLVRRFRYDVNKPLAAH